MGAGMRQQTGIQRSTQSDRRKATTISRLETGVMTVVEHGTGLDTGAQRINHRFNEFC